MVLTLVIGGVIVFASFVVWASFMYDRRQKKRTVNPKVKEFELNLKKRRFLLVNGKHYATSIFIKDGDEFLRFAKRSGVHTIFREKCEHYGEINYFCIVKGVIVRTYFSMWSD